MSVAQRQPDKLAIVILVGRTDLAPQQWAAQARETIRLRRARRLRPDR